MKRRHFIQKSSYALAAAVLPLTSGAQNIGIDMNNTKALSSGEKRLQISLAKVEGWIEDFSKVRVFPDEDIEQYIANNTDVKIYYTFSPLYENGMANLRGALLLAADNPQQAIILFHQGAKRRVFSTGLQNLFMKRSGHTMSLPDKVTHDLLSAICTGQIPFVKQQFKILSAALKGGYGVNPKKNWNDEWRFSAMGLTLLGEFFEMPVDLDALGWPRDPAWMPLAQYWNSDDIEKAQSVLLDACDVHMERISLSSAERDSGNFEFFTPYMAVHPTEILAVLRLREALGLQNPELDHPLMNTPYAKLTCGIDFKAEPDELLDALLQAVRQRDPDIAQWWDEALK